MGQLIFFCCNFLMKWPLESLFDLCYNEYMNEKKIRIAFRAPRLPTIIISKDRLFTGITRKGLEKFLKISSPPNDEKEITLIDSTVEEFWYMPEDMILAPGMTIYNKWKKVAWRMALCAQRESGIRFAPCALRFAHSPALLLYPLSKRMNPLVHSTDL